MCVGTCVYVCVFVQCSMHRRYRGQADNYAVMEDIGVSSFQSIPYTLNQMPECPILICHGRPTGVIRKMVS